MATGMVREGSRWGRVQCIEAGEKERVQSGGGVSEVSHESYYLLACDCSPDKPWLVWVSEFQGKRAVRDCGCGIGLARDQTVMLGVSMPKSMADAIDAAAYGRRLNRSQLVRDVLANWLAEKGAVNGKKAQEKARAGTRKAG